MTINTATLTGTGFTMSGVTAPVDSGAGPDRDAGSGVRSNYCGRGHGAGDDHQQRNHGSNATIALSGTGVSTAHYEVQLTWDAPTETTDPAVGYQRLSVHEQRVVRTAEYVGEYTDNVSPTPR